MEASYFLNYDVNMYANFTVNQEVYDLMDNWVHREDIELHHFVTIS